MEKLAINVTTGPLKPVGFKVGVGFGNTATNTPEEDSDDNEDD